MKKRTVRKVVRISIRVEAAKLVKVKAHTRRHNGKIKRFSKSKTRGLSL